VDLDGKTILITGSSGIGAASARLASVYGARVFVCGLDAGQCENLAEEIGGSCYAGDLSDVYHAERAVAQCISEFGPVDGLFNVAGGSGRTAGDGPLHLVSDEGWKRTLDMNLLPMFYVTRTVLRRMIPRGTGSIVHLSSVTAYSPEPKHFATHAYAAAKGALISLTKTMAAYYASSGIRVNAIAPGLTRTPMSLRAQSDEKILAQMKTKQPLAGSLIDPDDIARAALFLLSDAARYITGQVLGVDAGWEVS
jgi:NAD(P)-dependent dehydrogenase (short-subunit alcohol dehydrogenase family)